MEHKMNREFIKLDLHNNLLILKFENCKETVEFLQKYPIGDNFLAALLDSDSISIELKYNTTEEAVDNFKDFNKKIKLFIKEMEQ
jgi:hypothetical protein